MADNLLNLSSPQQWQEHMQNKPGFWEWAIPKPVREGVSTGVNTLVGLPQAAGQLGQNINQAMMENRAQHPIYGNLGTQAGWGEQPAPATPEAGLPPQPQSPFGMMRDQGNPAPSENLTGNPITDYIDPLMEQITGKKGDEQVAPPSPLRPEEMGQVLANPDIPPEEKSKLVQKNSETSGQQAKDDMKAQGATEEELGAFDKFLGQFDFTTVGMALLASNDGKSNLSSNLGKALMMGRQAKMNQEATKAEAELEERKQKREDRKVDVDETYKTGTLEDRKAQREAQIAQWGIQNGITKNANETDAQYKDRMARVAEANSYTNWAKMKADAVSGLEFKPANATTKAYARQGLDVLGVKPGEFNNLPEEAVLDAIGGLIATELEANPGKDRQTVARQAAELWMKDFENKAIFFGQDWEQKGKP